MKKPSYKSGIRAWESELKKLNATIRKAQKQGIFIEETTIARPKRATEKQVTKVVAIREQVKQRIKAAEEERPKQRQAAEAIETRTRKAGAGVEEHHARTRYANPKEDTTLSPEERAERRRVAAKKAAETRKKREAEMPTEQREALRKKRADRFKKAIEKTRSKAAKKAAETRKKKEEAMSPEEREALRKKRAEQLNRNIGRIKKEEDLLPPTDEEAPPTYKALYHPREAELAYAKIVRYIEDIESTITNLMDAQINQGARVLRDLLNNAISEFGYDEVMRRISTDIDRFEVNAEVILYDSDRNHVQVAINDMIALLLGRPLTIEEAKEYEKLYDDMPSDDDLIPLDLLEEPPEF